MNLKKNWWKILAVICIINTIIGGLIFKVPRLPILNETIRNLYFHVPMWFGMIVILFVSLFYSIKYLSKSQIKDDITAKEAANTGILFGILGLATGSLWAKFTWGAFWVGDPRTNGAAISILIYMAYFVLRNSMDEEQKRARISAVYNVFAYVMLIVFLIVYPRLNKVDSLHPGIGGNPGFSIYESELDGKMRMVFYPAIIGWILLGVWMMSIRIRIENLKLKLDTPF